MSTTPSAEIPQADLFASRDILAKMPVALWAADTKGVLTHVEGGLHAATGQDPKELLGKSIFDIAASKKRKEMSDWYWRALGGEEFTVTMTVDGRVLEVRCAPYMHEGAIVGAVAFATDVTECRLAQEDHEMLASLVKSSFDAIVGKTLEGTIVSWNPAAERMYGFKASEAVGKNVADLIIPEDKRDEFNTFMKAIRRGETLDPIVTERVHKDGRRKYVSITVSPLKNARGEVNGASAISRDVTGEWWAEREKEAVIFITTVFQRTERLEHLLRLIPPMLSSRFQFPLVAIELFDEHSKEMVLVASHGFGADGLDQPTRLPIALSACGSMVIATGEPMTELHKTTQLHFNVPAPITVNSNTTICVPIKLNSKPIGTITLGNNKETFVDASLVVTMRVIADVVGQEIGRYRAETELRESQDRFRTIVDNSSDIIMRASPTGVVTWASEAVNRILGYTVEEFTAKSGYDYIHPDDIAASQQTHSRLLATDTVQQLRIRMRRNDGEYVPLELRLRSIRDKSNTVQEIVVVAREVAGDPRI